MHEKKFCQKAEDLAATSNLRVEQNLVHLGRFLHFSQKLVGVILSAKNVEICKGRGILKIFTCIRGGRKPKNVVEDGKLLWCATIPTP